MRTDVDEQRILDLNRRFHDEVEAGSYDRRMGVRYDQSSINAMIRELENVLGDRLQRAGGKVVDVASGTGNVAIKLSLTGWYDEVIAVDISSKSLEVASKRAEDVGCALTTIVSDMRRLPFEDDSIDFVVGCAFLHHLPNPLLFMREVHRVLKPGCPFVFIGEPTKFGSIGIEVAKLPLVLANSVIRRVRNRQGSTFVWDHDNIDVHVFSQNDAKRFVQDFDSSRIISEGFALPIIDQGLFTPIRLVFGENKFLQRAFAVSGRALAGIDYFFLNRTLPKGLKTSLKLSGKKPYPNNVAHAEV